MLASPLLSLVVSWTPRMQNEEHRGSLRGKESQQFELQYRSRLTTTVSKCFRRLAFVMLQTQDFDVVRELCYLHLRSLFLAPAVAQ